MEITQELVRYLFDYKNGALYWKNSRSTKIKPGDFAGSRDKWGYINIDINNKKQKAHRLVFLYHHGYLPEIVDHINGNPSDNNIENLRAATKSENARNAKRNSNNTSGVKGVIKYKDSGKYGVFVTLNYNRMYLGVYDDLELAELVATEARNKYHGEFANHGKQDEKVST